MKVSAYVAANSRRAYITQSGPNELKVGVRESPIDGKANKAVIRAVAGFFNVAPSLVSIIRGKTGKRKILEIGGR